MGKEQKVHNFIRLISEPYILFLVLAGFLIGFNVGFYIFSAAVICPLLVLPLLLSPAFSRKKAGIIAVAAALLIGFFLGVPKTIARNDYGIYEGVVIENKPNYFVFESGFHRYYVYEKGTEREEGDILSIEGIAEPLKFTTYEGYFDFEDYLSKKGVDSELRPKSISVKWERPIRFASREKAFLENFDDPLTRGLLSSVLFGDKDYSNEAISMASGMNALNFLSVSGLLFQAILGFFDWFFYLGFKDKTSKTTVLGISVLLLPFGFKKVGFWRVFLGRVIAYVGFMNNKEIDPIKKTSIAGLILFLLNPYNAVSSGYLIGFGLSFFMIFTKPYRVKYKKFDRQAADLLFLMVFLCPLFIKGNEFHVLSPFYSFILLPFVYPFAALGLMSFISLPFITVLGAYSKFLLGYLNFLQTFDYSVTVGGFNELTTFAYYYGMTLFFYLWDRGFTNISMKLASLGMGALLTNVCPILNYAIDQVTFLNVGQGDCIFIRNKDKTVMIDVGGNTGFDLAKEVTIPFLRKERVQRLDYVIITHYDADHSGALESLKTNFIVNHVLDNPNQFPLTIGDLLIENLNEGIPNSSNENDNSLVLSMSFIGKTWLFMGDAPEKVEREIIKKHPDLDCDILKVGHHGSDTSTCEEFLEKVTPEEAIISVGKKNKYGHPADKIQLRLARHGTRIRRTDLEGTITYRKLFGFL